MVTVLSLVIAILAVFFGPIVAWEVARQQIAATARETWMRDLREKVAVFLSAHQAYLVHNTQPASAIRAKAHDDLRAIRHFRNRIAHHEPIFTRHIAAEYTQLHDMIALRSPVAAAWMDKQQGVTSQIPLAPQ